MGVERCVVAARRAAQQMVELQPTDEAVAVAVVESEGVSAAAVAVRT